jgi:hypothetical protein
VVKDGNDKNIPRRRAKNERVWESAQNDSAELALDDRVCLRVSCRGLQCGLQGSNEVQAEAGRARFVPISALKSLGSCLRPEENAHLVIALQQLSANLLPRDGARRVGFVGL